MFATVCVLLFFPFGTFSQTWHNKACIENHLGYLQNLLQETMYRVEKDVKYCNMKVDNLNKTVNDRMYSWHLVGQVQYTNSFLISIEKIDVSAISTTVSRRVVNDTAEYDASITSTINFRNPSIGFDVLVQLENMEEQRYTGVFTYLSISIPITLRRNLNTNETTLTTTHAGQSSRFVRMQFTPETNVSQVLGRNFHGYDISNSFTKWGREIIIPIMKNLATTEIEFPAIRVDGCPK